MKTTAYRARTALAVIALTSTALAGCGSGSSSSASSASATASASSPASSGVRLLDKNDRGSGSDDGSSASPSASPSPSASASSSAGASTELAEPAAPPAGYQMGFSLVSNQPQYSALWRVIEEEVVPASEELGVGQIVWSPMAQGVLSGKYLPGQEPPAGSRATDEKGGQRMISRWMSDEVLTAV